MRILMIFALCIASSLAGAQQMYRWVDKDGKVHYTQTPPPPEAAKSVQRKSLGAGPAPAGALPYATQVAMKNSPVTLYTSSDCGAACEEGRKYLNQRGVPHKEIRVVDEKGIEELKRVSGKASVPTLFVGRDMQTGFETEAWKNALDAAGYPASAPAIAPLAAVKPPPGPAASAEKLPVSLYTSPDCGAPCSSAKELLNGRAIPFKEITVGDPASLEELNKLSGGTTVPVLIVGSAVQRGFEPSLYNSALDAAGYAPGPAAKR